MVSKGAIDNTEALISDKLPRETLDAVLKSLAVDEYIKLDVIERK